MEGMHMTNSDETPQQAPRRRRYKRIRNKDSWLRDRHDPTPEEMKQWNDAGMPPHVDIVGGFLATNNFIFGIPDRAELYRLDALTKESDKMMFGGSEGWWENSLRLRYVQPTPIPAVYYTMAHPPLGTGMGDMVEVNYNVRLTALICEMRLVNVHVIHHGLSDDDRGIVFEGVEYPGPAVHHRIRVVRVTVIAPDVGTWKTVSETTYPRSIV
jgi:hypothetical protein